MRWLFYFYCFVPCLTQRCGGALEAVFCVCIDLLVLGEILPLPRIQQLHANWLVKSLLFTLSQSGFSCSSLHGFSQSVGLNSLLKFLFILMCHSINTKCGFILPHGQYLNVIVLLFNDLWTCVKVWQRCVLCGSEWVSEKWIRDWKSEMGRVMEWEEVTCEG